jgi:hypothetical protein
MQRTFADRSHNFGSKLKQVKTEIVQTLGEDREVEVNRAITEVMRKGKIPIEETDQFVESVINIVNLSGSKKKYETILSCSLSLVC